MENTTQSYALALLTLMGNQEGANEDNPPLGMALHLETQSSVVNLAAHRLLRALIEYSPSPETIAQQFLTELEKCENPAVADLSDSDAVSTLYDPFYVKYYAQVRNLLSGDRSITGVPDDWAAEVLNELNKNGGNTSSVKNLAAFYLTHLVIACRVQCNIYWP